MQTSIKKRESQQLFRHPMLQDTSCLPKDLNYVLLIPQVTRQDQPEIRIVVPYHKKDTTFAELQETIATYGINHNGARYQIRLPEKDGLGINKYHQEGGEYTIQSFKMRFGKSKERREILRIVPQKLFNSELQPFQTVNNDKYQVCLILFTEQLLVLTLTMRWTPQIDPLAAIKLKINGIYKIDLKDEDLEFSLLQFDRKLQDQAFRIVFKRTQMADRHKLINQIFYNLQPVFIGIDIKNIKLIQLKKPIENSSHIGEYKLLAANKKQDCSQTKSILVLQLENYIAFRIYYDQVKAFKVKFLLGIFKVQQSHRKGLMVLGKIYKPDDLISSFEHAFLKGSHCNFIHAKVTTERELFQRCILNENDVQVLTYEEIKSLLDIKAKPQVQCPCLSSYLNQALFPNDHNESQRLVSQITQNYIYNYFIEIKSYEQTTWQRYIKTMLLELSAFEKYRGWAFRVVNFHYDRQINHILEFPNFIVASKREDKVAFKYQVNPNQPKTLFRIKSMSGLLVNQISPFRLDQVIFRPYTSFKIIRKILKEKLIQYQLEEVEQSPTISRYNLLVWVDDKKKEGLNIFHQLKQINILFPVYLFQVASNAQLRTIMEQYQHLFRDPNARKIVISNMKRFEQGTINYKAGVQTYKIVHMQFKDNMKFIFYIGYIEGTVERLRQNKISLDTSSIFNDGGKLLQKLYKLANHEDLSKMVNKIQSEVQKEKEDNQQWSGVFSVLKPAKSSVHK